MELARPHPSRKPRAAPPSSYPHGSAGGDDHVRVGILTRDGRGEVGEVGTVTFGKMRRVTQFEGGVQVNSISNAQPRSVRGAMGSLP